MCERVYVQVCRSVWLQSLPSSSCRVVWERIERVLSVNVTAKMKRRDDVWRKLLVHRSFFRCKNVKSRKQRKPRKRQILRKHKNARRKNADKQKREKAKTRHSLFWSRDFLLRCDSLLFIHSCVRFYRFLPIPINMGRITRIRWDGKPLSSVWPDDGIKSCLISQKIAQKVVTHFLH